MSVRVKLLAPLDGPNTAVVTPEPSPTATTPRAKMTGPIDSLVDNAPLASGDLTLKTKRVWPLDAHEG